MIQDGRAGRKGGPPEWPDRAVALGVVELLVMTLAVIMLLGPVIAGAFLAIRLSGRRRENG